MNATLIWDGVEVTFSKCEEMDCIEKYLIQTKNWWEPEMMRCIQDLKVVGNYLDVGSYIGTFSIFASLFCPAQTVYAFEPQIDIYQKMMVNLNVNKISNVKPYNKALSNYKGTGQLVGYQTNRGAAILHYGDSVQVIQLDSIKLPNIKLVKIDATASELNVLKGGSQTLKNADHIFVEYWPEEVCDRYCLAYTGQEVEDMLSSWGFVHQCVFPCDNHYWKKV